MNKKRGDMSILLAISLLFILLFSAGGLAYIYKDNLDKQKISKEDKDKVTKEVVIDELISEEGFKSNIIEVEWLESFDIKNSTRKSMNTFVDEGGVEISFRTYYMAGVVKNGEFRGQNIYVGTYEAEGMGDSGKVVHFVYIERNGKITPFILEENSFLIKDISDIPKNFKVFGYSAELVYIYTLYAGDVENYPNQLNKLNIRNNFGEVYGHSDAVAVVVFLHDGSYAHYNITIPFLNKENGIISVLFNDGKINDEQYSTYPTVSRVVDLDSRIQIAGETEIGENIFELKDPNDQILKELYERKSTYAVMSNTDNPGQNKYSYEEFLNFHPILYWKDPFGRFMEFKNKRFEVVAEKGKPVIYLYPKEEVKLNVQVDPNGGFTKTIPKYPEGGWNVIAYPNSRIIDLSDNSEYSYLFWSGLAFDYPEIKEGWVVKKEELGEFFNAKLNILGMNDSEIADFNEYWIEMMNKKPFYLVSFVSQREIDEISPLKIEPIKPDTIIRVLMSAKGIDKPILIKEQKMPKTPNREGFVVVEWGGTILPN